MIVSCSWNLRLRPSFHPRQVLEGQSKGLFSSHLGAVLHVNLFSLKQNKFENSSCWEVAAEKVSLLSLTLLDWKWNSTAVKWDCVQSSRELLCLDNLSWNSRENERETEFSCCWLTSLGYRNTMIFGFCTLFLQFYAYGTKEVFFPLQVCTIYLVNYYLKELAHGSVLLLSSKHKIVKTKFLS